MDFVGGYCGLSCHFLFRQVYYQSRGVLQTEFQCYRQTQEFDKASRYLCGHGKKKIVGLVEVDGFVAVGTDVSTQ